MDLLLRQYTYSNLEIERLHLSTNDEIWEI